MTDWNLYRKCSQVCGAETGQPCVSRSGSTANAPIALPVPHKSRKRRTRTPAYTSAPLAR